MVVKIVIGSNFGDEGKGLMTEYFCHQAALRGDKTIVVCHNGGAQRGHTVTTPEGRNHVFHHFGSGTLIGSDTYLSEKFILNPMIFKQERDELESLGCKPIVYVHPGCRVSTPYDMILNQLKEEVRAGGKHGSCGIGIYETICRYRDKANSHSIRTFSNMSKNDIREYLQKVRSQMIQTAESYMPTEWNEIVTSEGLLNNYLDDLCFMVDSIKFEKENVLGDYGTIVFEGGQGLLLDKNNSEYYPHLTPSNTGVKNPIEILSKMHSLGSFDIEVCYVTRTYITRHGAGRLDYECQKEEINPGIKDLTNVPNPHQGNLRYAKVDPIEIFERANKDYLTLKANDVIKKSNSIISLAITHCNEHSGLFAYVDDGLRAKTNTDLEVYFNKVYRSTGKTRNEVL